MPIYIQGIRRGWRVILKKQGIAGNEVEHTTYYAGMLRSPRGAQLRVFAYEIDEILAAKTVTLGDQSHHFGFFAIRHDALSDSVIQQGVCRNVANDAEKHIRAAVKSLEDWLKPGDNVFEAMDAFGDVGSTLSCPDLSAPQEQPAAAFDESIDFAAAAGAGPAEASKKAVDKLMETPPKFDATNLKQFRENLEEYAELAEQSTVGEELVIYYLKNKTGIPNDKFPPKEAYDAPTKKQQLEKFILELMKNCSPSDQDRLSQALAAFFDAHAGILDAKDPAGWLNKKEKQRGDLAQVAVKFDDRTYGGIVLHLAKLTPEAAVAVFGWIKGDLDYHSSVKPALISVVGANGVSPSRDATALRVQTTNPASFQGYCNYEWCRRWGHREQDCRVKHEHQRLKGNGKGKGKGQPDNKGKGKGKKGGPPRNH